MVLSCQKNGGQQQGEEVKSNGGNMGSGRLKEEWDNVICAGQKSLKKTNHDEQSNPC